MSVQMSETWWPECVDRADVYDDQEEAGDSGAGVATCPLMQERKSLAKYRDLHVTLM